MPRIKVRPDGGDLRRQLAGLVLAQCDGRSESLDVEFHRDSFVLSGRVGSYYVKQLAQTIALQSFPDVPLRNDIVVVPPL